MISFVYFCSVKRSALIIALLMLAEGALADDWDVHRPYGANRPIGLSASINVGMLIANKKQAEFYSGNRIDPDIDADQTYLERMIHSERFGNQIWTDLVDGGYISPSAIQNYSQLKVVEPAKMHYKLTYQIGLGIRYDWESGWGGLLRFDWSRLTAVGAFNLSSTNGTGILQNDNQYVQCSVGGVENRINIDLGIAKRFFLSESFALELDLGFNLNNLKVKKNMMEIAGRTHDILDIYGSNGPMLNGATYEYINQGGVGFGGFAGVALCYIVPGENSVGTIDFGYNFYYEKLKLEGYSGYAPQHAIFLRFNLNTFSFFNK